MQISNQKNGDCLYNTYIEYMIKIVVIGAGVIDRIIAVDLEKEFDLTPFGVNEDSLPQLHLKDKKIQPFKGFAQLLQL